MVKPRSFGRRTNPLPQQPNMAVPKAVAPAADDPPPSLSIAPPAPDDELEAWTRARRTNFRFPWRQVSLVASLCFGIASFVLPDTVNDGVQWLVYALAAASLDGGVAKRHKIDR